MTCQLWIKCHLYTSAALFYIYQTIQHVPFSSSFLTTKMMHTYTPPPKKKKNNNQDCVLLCDSPAQILSPGTVMPQTWLSLTIPPSPSPSHLLRLCSSVIFCPVKISADTETVKDTKFHFLCSQDHNDNPYWQSSQKWNSRIKTDYISTWGWKNRVEAIYDTTNLHTAQPGQEKNQYWTQRAPSVSW